MRKRTSLLGAATLFAVLGSACAQQYTGPPADLVIRNAKVVTIDQDRRRAQAVAMIGEEIVGVTSNRAIEQYIEEGTTQVIDAGGRLVIPLGPQWRWQWLKVFTRTPSGFDEERIAEVRFVPMLGESQKVSGQKL